MMFYIITLICLLNVATVFAQEQMQYLYFSPFNYKWNGRPRNADDAFFNAINHWQYNMNVENTYLDNSDDYEVILTTGEVEELLHDKNVIWIGAHAGPSFCVETYKYDDFGYNAADASRTEQLQANDICGSLPCNCAGTNPGQPDCDELNHFSVLRLDNLGGEPMCWGILMTEAGVDQHLSPSDANLFNDMVMFIDACNGDDWCDNFTSSQAYNACAGWSVSAAWEEVFDIELERFWNRLGCVHEDWGDRRWWLETIDEAVMGVSEHGEYDPYMESILAGIGFDTWNVYNFFNSLGGYLVSCRVAAPPFYRYGKFSNTVYWATKPYRNVICYEIRGYQNIDDAPTIIAEIPAENISEDNWGKLYATFISADFTYYEITEIPTSGAPETTGLFAQGSMPDDWDQLLDPDYWMNRQAQNSGGGSYIDIDLDKYSVGIGYEVVICAVSGAMANPIEEQLERYDKTFTYMLVPDPDAEIIRDGYSLVVAENLYINNAYYGGEEVWPVEPGPMLILVGAHGDHSTSIPAWQIPDLDGSCYMAGICVSDYLLTDIDDDEIPNGPVTRVPATNPDQVNICVDMADNYNDGQIAGPVKQAIFFCNDYVENYYLPTLRAWEMYRDAGFTTREILRTSVMPTNWHDRFSIAADLFNDNYGVLEVFGLGHTSDNNNWLNIFIQPGADEYNLFTREQIFVAWLPGCHMGHVSAAAEGLFYGGPISTDLMYAENSNTQARLAGLVGHINAGWSIGHEIIAYSLIDARRQAIPGETTIAEIAYQAVVNAINDKPGFTQHALGLGVLGAYVKIPDVSLTGVDESTSRDEVKIFANGGSRIKITYSIPHNGEVNISIFDIRGRKVDELFKGTLPGGTYTVYWGGTNQRGERVASGVYIGNIQVVSGELNVTKTAKLLLVR